VVLRDEREGDHELDTLGPGAVLGEMALLTKESRNADVIALGPVRALALTADDFAALVERHPEFAEIVTQIVADRLGQAARDGLGGKVLHGYRLRRRLGKGTTAVVYEAVSVDTGERVALKMLSHTLALDSEAIARFQREVRIVKRLTDPLIARVHDQFEAYGTRFMVMEFYDGRDLEAVLAGHGRLEPFVVRCLVGQLAKALSHVHGHGVVHKDLKPANVMMLPNGWIRLMDFGVSRPPLTLRENEERLIAGTLAYMAPEQFASPSADPAVDLYALGCVAYELLTGEVPIEGDDFATLYRLKRAGEIRPIEEVRPGTPEDLAALIGVCLAPEPRDRKVDLYETATWAHPVPLTMLLD